MKRTDLSEDEPPSSPDEDDPVPPCDEEKRDDDDCDVIAPLVPPEELIDPEAPMPSEDPLLREELACKELELELPCVELELPCMEPELDSE